MSKSSPFLLCLLGVAFVFSGCLGSGSLKSGGATLSYDGSENGKHEEATKCNADGHIEGYGDIQDGQVHVQLRDGGGSTIWEQTYSAGFRLNSTTVTGESGTWTLSADRGGNDLLGDQFNGDYRFVLTC